MHNVFEFNCDSCKKLDSEVQYELSLPSPIRTQSSKPCTLYKEAHRRRRGGKHKGRKTEGHSAIEGGEAKSREQEKGRSRRSQHGQNKRGEEGEEKQATQKAEGEKKSPGEPTKGGAPTLTLFISFAASLSFCLVPHSARSPQAISP